MGPSQANNMPSVLPAAPTQAVPQQVMPNPPTVTAQMAEQQPTWSQTDQIPPLGLNPVQNSPFPAPYAPLPQSASKEEMI